MDTLLQDVRYATRKLLRAPGFYVPARLAAKVDPVIAMRND